jgi:hypothetical protein
MRLLSRIVVLPACSSASTDSLAYDLTEFEISGPESLVAGGVTVSVSNSGEFPHTLVIAEQDGRVLAATDMIQPGATVAIDVDLGPCRYQFSCRVVGEKPNGSIVDHFEEGMVQTVSVSS